PLGFKDHHSGAPILEEFAIDQIATLPTLGTPVYDGGQPEVMLGGFSGLWYEEAESSPTEYVFYAIPDRGPNDGTVNSSLTTPPAAGNLRPFKLPNYQGRIVRFTLDIVSGTLALDSAEQIFLTHPNGRTPISGRGNAPGIDEVPVTYTDAATVYGDSSFEAGGEYYHLLEYDQYGGDFEGIVIDPAGNFWMCDEYRPAIYQFSPEGVMQNRFIPAGTKARVVTNGIFFSEYGEGSSNNKFLEIYNGTSDTVNLEDYLLVNCGNACTTPGEFEFDNSGLFTGKSIAPQEVFVIAHPSAQADILAEADTQFQFLSNGNDWFALLNASDSSLVDQIGESATSGITDGWDVAGVPTATKDFTLIRKHYILSGSTDWAASAGTDSINSEWIVEERPTADTVLSSLGAHMDYGTESLPAVYGKRRANRGFEALALDTDEGILYAFIQTPLYNPSNVTQNNSDVIRILGIDPATGTPVREYVYLLERNANLRWDIGRVDKIGDAVYVGGGKFRILERDSSVPGESEGKKYVFEFNLKGATNILGTPLSMRDTGSATLELLPLDQLADSGIVPVHKRKILNLPTIGYQASDKPEGLAMLPDGQMAVLNDNDFGLAGAGVSDASTLGIISFDTNYGIDPSDRDDSIRIVNVPVLGPYQPDAIDLFEVDGTSYLITANEGDGRDYDGYSEEERVKDILLDSLTFPNFSVLQEDEEIGRLTITTANGDLDGDGDFDEIYAYGSRSFSIWDAYGNLVWDSGDDLERITADLFPDFFNSNNDDNNSFESRSDNKGPEPEAVVIADLDTALYAFVGLERMGGIMVYRIDDPAAPEFVEYELNRDFFTDAQDPATGDLGPEDLKFISANESPNGIPLIVVGNEVSGSISIYQLFEEPIIISNDAPINLKPLVAFPNPANGNEIYLNQHGNYQLLNLVGQELSRVKNSDRFDISSLNAGMYLIRNDKNQAVRFIKR
ncbi:MAG: choice-of-anchor I family protein, partial [Bacteroidota bacterium]